MTPTLSLAAVLGIALGAGLWTLVALMPRWGSRSLADRVAPHVLDVSAEARALRARRTGEPAWVLALLVAPAIDRGRRALTRMLGGDAVVARRLRQAGSGLGVAGFRSRQLAWAVGGAAGGLVLAVLLARSVVVSPLVAVALGAALAAAGLLLPEQLLARASHRRLARVAAELPSVLEFLSLALSAGETVRDALRRVARIGSGELAAELAGVIADVDVGVPLGDALSRMSDALELPALSRAVEQLVTALERGTPLVDVLRAQAQASREDARRVLLEAGGRKEVAMLVPLVFLILPVTVLFAVFPAALVLQLGF